VLSAEGNVKQSNSTDSEQKITRDPLSKSDDRTRIGLNELECAYTWQRGRFLIGRHPITVVSGVSFEIHRGETLGLVGESGSGKSTIAKAVAGLIAPISGEMSLDNEELPASARRRPRNSLRRIQLVMQNPDASLNPRQRVESIVGRPLKLFFGHSKEELRTRVLDLLESVQLDHTYLRRFPGEMSGGERQRVAIARALAADPEFLLCDEIVSALDVSVQAQVLALLRGLQRERNIGILFISHDLAVVRSISHRVAVLYRGALMEVGETDEVYSPPYHPYTHVLLSAVPDIDPDKPIATVRGGIEEEIITETKPACAFANSCPWKLGSICDEVVPPRRKVSEFHEVRCHIPLEDLYAMEKPLGDPIAAMSHISES
jgi:peptide/nickel transport system ATP-binding protein